MTHEEIKTIYREVYFPYGIEFNQMAELANLTVIIFNSVKKKEPKITIYDVLKRVMGDSDTNHDPYFIPLCITLEVFLESNELMFQPRTYGFSTPKQITERIKQILENYLPF